MIVNQLNLNSNKILKFRSTPQMQMPQNQQMQSVQPAMDIPLPRIYQIPEEKEKQSFKDSLKKVDIMNLVVPWLEHPFMMLGTCFGLAWGVDKFSSACSGEYEKSLVGKVTRFGDNLENSKFVKSKPVQTVLDFGSKAKKKLLHPFRNSDLIRAMKDTPAHPEWTIVKHETLSMEQHVAQEFMNIANKLVLHEGSSALKGLGKSESVPIDYISSSKLGINKKEQEFLKEFFKDVAQKDEVISNTIQLKRLECLNLSDDAIREIVAKPNASELVAKKYLEAWGFEDGFLSKFKENPPSKEDLEKIREACKKAPDVRIAEGHQKLLGPVQPFKRTISCSEVGNRLTSIGEAKTKTGRLLSTFLQKCHRGFTFGGGKMGVLFFVSPILVETMLNVKKAEPNEKISTAAHGLTHSMSWVFTFPLAVNILYNFCGVKYAGMSKDAVEESRKLIKEFNEKANPYVDKKVSIWAKIKGTAEKKPAGETFQTLEEYKEAKKVLKNRLKELRTAKDQNLFTKITKNLGKFLSMDLECISSYKNGNFFASKARGIGNTLKNVGGVPMRLGLFFALSMGVLDGIINKGLKACFGTHYDNYQEEEFEVEKKEQKKFAKEDLKQRLREAQKQKVLGLSDNTATEFVIPEEIQKTLKEQQLRAEVEKNLKNERAKASKVVLEDSGLNKNTDSAEVKNVFEESMKVQEEVSEPQVSSTVNPVAEEQISLQSEDSPKISLVSPVAQQDKNLNNSIVAESSSLQMANSDQVEPIKVLPIDKPFTQEVNIESAQNLPPVDSYTYIPNSDAIKLKSMSKKGYDNYTYIPSSVNVLNKNDKNKIINKYVPSQRAANISKTFDNSGLEAALRRADRAEQKAIEVLSGKFSSV